MSDSPQSRENAVKYHSSCFLRYAIVLAATFGVTSNIAHAGPAPAFVKKVSFSECVTKTKDVEDAYYNAHPEESRRDFVTDTNADYLFRRYLVTPKWDTNGCFEWKDPWAAEKAGKSLKQYVVECMAPEWVDALAGLFRALEARGFKPGFTCGYRGFERQAITEGNAAPPGKSLHGKLGCYHGLATDMVAISAPEVTEDEHYAENEKLWLATDLLASAFHITRLRGKESMHVQAAGSLRQAIFAAAGSRDVKVASGKKKHKLARKRQKSKFAANSGKHHKHTARTEKKEKKKHYARR